MKRTSIKIMLAAIALVFIVIGCFEGGYHDTFMKAVYICLECIGIG